jgi:nucleotide-binding universal stress UspA family protein
LLDFTHGDHEAWAEERPAPAPKIILVPLDFSGGSPAALTIAWNLALKSKATLVLLHVVQLNIAGEERGIQRTRLLNELCRDAERRLLQLAGCLGDQVATECLVCEGRPAKAILETASGMRADTIVMWTHGRRGWLKWLHRNTALKVARQATCNIWLVSPAKCDATANLMVVDHKVINWQAKRLSFHERRNRSRTLIQVLFS